MATKPGSSGRVTKSILVETDAPEVQRLRLGVTFETVVPIQVTPAHRISVNTLQGSAQTERVRLHRQDGEVLQARLSGTALPPGVQVRVVPVQDEPGQSSGDQWLEVSVDGGSGVVNHNGLVVLATNDPAAPELRIPLSIRVRPTIDVRPSPVQLWPADGGPDRTSGLVRLGHGARLPFEITEIAVSDPTLIRAEAISQGLQPIHSVKVALIDGATVDGPVVRATVRIGTSDAALPVVELPVQIHARSQVMRRPAGPAAPGTGAVPASPPAGG